MYNYTFTIFTPSYNASETINRVYESLMIQTFTNFEWIIVDDGSKDNTKEIVENFIQKANFSIRYYKQKNQGKASAINFAVPKAMGKFFIIADADDSFNKESLDTFHKIWKEYGNNQYCGISALCKDQYSNPIGEKFPTDIYFTNYLIAKYTTSIFSGEKWLMIRTEIMKQFPFKTSMFIPESHVWNAMGYKYDIIGINKILRTYYINESSSSITAIGRQAPRYESKAFIYYELITKFKTKFSLRVRSKFYKKYVQNSLYAKISPYTLISKFNNMFDRLICSIYLPIELIKWRLTK